MFVNLVALDLSKLSFSSFQLSRWPPSSRGFLKAMKYPHSLVRHPRGMSRLYSLRWCAALLAASMLALPLYHLGSHGAYDVESSVEANILAKCAAIRVSAGPPASYDMSRRIAKGSDRHVVGTPPTLIQNARIWTAAQNGTELLFGDILLDKGLVLAIGTVPGDLLADVRGKNRDMQVVDAGGKWVTPGLVDLHSHIGVNSAPSLEGSCRRANLTVCSCQRW